jgi:hypothetical protein
MQMPTSKVENSAQVLSCLLKFVHVLIYKLASLDPGFTNKHLKRVKNLVRGNTLAYFNRESGLNTKVL